MGQKFKNNARALLAAGITASDTSIVVEGGYGDLFPVATLGLGSSGDWFKATLELEGGEREIVKVRTRASGSDVFSEVVRAQEGSTALICPAGTVIGLRFTAADVQGVLDSAFPANTVMLFVQSSAPVGWTKLTSHNDKALRVVSGTAGSGGGTPFSTFFDHLDIIGTTAPTALSVAQLPAHEHAIDGSTQGYSNGVASSIHFGQAKTNPNYGGLSRSVGGGEGHSHGISFAVDMHLQYVDVIMARKD